MNLRGLNWAPPRSGRGAWYIWQRNALVWRRYMYTSLLLNLGEPLLYLLGLGYGLGTLVGELDGLAYLSFLASGMVATASMNSATFEGLYSVFARMTHQRTYEAILATPLEVDDIVSGEMLWAATKGTISSVSILLVGVAIGALDGPGVLLCVPLALLIGLCFAGPAIAVSALAPSYDFFNYYVTLLLTPMFIFCGVFYPISSLPAALQPVVQLLPLTHAVALVRPLATGGSLGQPLLHIAVLATWGLLGFYVAVVMIRRRLIV